MNKKEIIMIIYKRQINIIYKIKQIKYIILVNIRMKINRIWKVMIIIDKTKYKIVKIIFWIRKIIVIYIKIVLRWKFKNIYRMRIF